MKRRQFLRSIILGVGALATKAVVAPTQLGAVEKSVEVTHDAPPFDDSIALPTAHDYLKFRARSRMAYTIIGKGDSFAWYNPVV